MRRAEHEHGQTAGADKAENKKRALVWEVRKKEKINPLVISSDSRPARIERLSDVQAENLVVTRRITSPGVTQP